MIGLLVFLFGLIIGSFLNAVIYRLKVKKSFLAGRSFCPQCKKPLAWFDNIPLASFLVLKGRCRQCRKKISWQYPLVEAAAAVIFLLIYWRFGLTAKFFCSAVFSCFLILIFVYDLRYYQILDKVSLPAIAVALPLNILLERQILTFILGALVGFAFFALQYFISRGKWVGDGDLRLGALMGVMLGWQGVLVALFLAYITGAVYGLTALALKKKKMDSQVPFGPFLTLGTFIALLWGQEIVGWYLGR